MTNKPLFDQEIIAQDERSRRAVFAIFAGFLVCVAIAILLFLAGGAHFISMWLVNVLGAALLLGWLLFAFMLAKSWTPPPAEAFGEEYLRKTIDLQHRQWRFQIISLLITLFAVAGVLTIVILHLYNDRFSLSVVACEYTVLALLAVLTVSFGPAFFVPSRRRVLNDELTITQQEKATRFGFILAVIAMCGVLITTAYNPQWGITVLPSAIAVVIALPGFYFLILQWRAGRGE